MAAAATGCGRRGGGDAAAGGAALRVGMELSYPPFEMPEAAGQPDGVGVRLAEALAASLQRPLQIVPMGFNGLIPALQTGHIDIIVSSLTANDERRKQIDFSEPYAFTGLALLVRKGAAIRSVEDLKTPGRVVAVKSATTGETWADRNLPQARKSVFEEQTACVQEVAQGRADAFIYDQLSIFAYARENPESTEGLLRPFVEESWAIGIGKGNDSLRGQVNAFLAAFRAERGFEKLADRYLKEEKALLDSMGIPFILR